MRNKAISRKMSFTLAHAIRRAREPTRPEDAGMQPRNFGNVLRGGFADDERKRHGVRNSGGRMGRLLAHFERRATLDGLANARGILGKEACRQGTNTEK